MRSVSRSFAGTHSCSNDADSGLPRTLASPYSSASVRLSSPDSCPSVRLSGPDSCPSVRLAGPDPGASL